MDWPKRALIWGDADVGYASIPFTWELPRIKDEIEQSLFYKRWVVGGPALGCMPDFFDGYENVQVLGNWPGILQRINPMATRTSLGCPNRCGYCAIGKGFVEGGGVVELEDWPDLPLLCDNNLLACSDGHFDKVMDRLECWTGVDFNQGLDARLLNDHHIERMLRLKQPKIRLSCDSGAIEGAWNTAVDRLRGAGVSKSNIYTYVLVGFMGDIDDDWRRCEVVEGKGVTINVQWFHALDCMKPNTVTEKQGLMGWSDAERTRIMGYYYRRRGEKRSIPPTFH